MTSTLVAASGSGSSPFKGEARRGMGFVIALKTIPTLTLPLKGREPRHRLPLKGRGS